LVVVIKALSSEIFPAEASLTFIESAQKFVADFDPAVEL
jgi:hypothetical protein